MSERHGLNSSSVRFDLADFYENLPSYSRCGYNRQKYLSFYLKFYCCCWKISSVQHFCAKTTIFVSLQWHVGYVVAQLLEALRYKSEGRGFDSRWYHWNFSLTQSCRPHYGTGVDSASNRNEYQEYYLGGKGGRCVGLVTLPPSCADCLEIWKP